MPMPITAGHAQAIDELMSLGSNHYARIEARSLTRAQARSVRKTAATSLRVATDDRQGHRNRGNLPAEWTSFIGRRRQIQEIKSVLTTARLVTLVGPGGVVRPAWRSGPRPT
jgi:hypothetical protein